MCNKTLYRQCNIRVGLFVCMYGIKKKKIKKSPQYVFTISWWLVLLKLYILNIVIRHMFSSIIIITIVINDYHYCIRYLNAR